MIIRVVGYKFFIHHYDPTKPRKNGELGTFVNRSVYMEGMQHRYDGPDELGGMRCGKLTAKQRENLPKDQQDEDKNKKWKRVVWGLVKMPGAKDAQGNHQPLEHWVPFEWILQGTNLMPIGEIIEPWNDPRKSDNIALHSNEMKVTTVEKVNGATTYFVAKFEPTANKYTGNDQLLDFIQTLRGHIASENAAIMDKHNAALKARQEGQKSEDFVNDLNDFDDSSLVDVTPSSGDMDDDIPF